MYQLKVEASFDAAHRLPEYNGPCRRVHGHHWCIQATWEHTGVLVDGIAIDLVILKRLLRETVVMYDHQSLNQIMANVPTAENIAQAIFRRLRAKDWGKMLTQVAVEETPGSCVVYREE